MRRKKKNRKRRCRERVANSELGMAGMHRHREERISGQLEMEGVAVGREWHVCICVLSFWELGREETDKNG